MKMLRWLIGIIVALLILVVAGVVLLVNFINPNDYRDQISQTISQKIHKPFSIQGDIGWLFFPEIGFKVNDMTVGDKANPKDIYAKLNYLEINLQLFPLIHKKIALDALRVDGAHVVLPAAVPAGDNNTAGGASSASSPEAALAAVPNLSLGELSVKNTDITQLNENEKPAWMIKNLALTASDIEMNNAIPFTASFNYVNPEKNMNADIQFASTLNWDTDDQAIRAKSTKLTVNTNANSTPNVALTLDVNNVLADLKDHTLMVKGLEGNLNKMDFSGDISVKNFDSTPTGNADWNMSSDNLGAFAHTFGTNLPSAIPGVQGKFSLKAQAQYGDNQLTLDPLTIQLANNTIQGQVKSNDLKNMALALTLQSTGLSTPEAGISGLKVNINVLPPPGPNKDWIASAVNGSVAIQSLNYQQQKIQNIQMLLDGKNKIFKLLKLHANAFSGSIDTTGVVNMQNKAPAFTVSPNVQNIQVGDLMKIVEPKFNITGIASMNGTISAEGTELPAIKRNLNGNIKISVKNGVLHGLDAAYWVNAASTLYSGHFGDAANMLSQPQGSSTQFGNISATLAIKQGVVNNQDFLLTGPIAQVKGTGTADLNRETINYRVQITKTNATTGKQHNDVVPLIISGTFDQPKVQPDMAEIARQVALNQKDEIVKKVMGKDLAASPIGQQVSDALGQLLGG